MPHSLATSFPSRSKRLLDDKKNILTKGRKIADQIFLAMEVVDHSEEDLQNGIIVALDQEKAYDKTSHRYLWKALEKRGIPNLFIDTLKSLYADAETHVMINGVTSSAFRVTRGVRQGDPLSCLLFNLAIEPLTEILRSSNLQGYHIPHVMEKIVGKMFADDTTVYLNALDSFEDLQEILKKWCAALSVKFNVEKTEIRFPFGSPEFRAEFLATRKLNPEAPPIPESIHIAQEGESVCILGARIGNGIDCFAIWTPINEKIDAALEGWAKLHPTLEARKNIIQINIGGMTQYFTHVNGMPEKVLKHLQRAQREFVWGGSKSSPVDQNTLMAPVAKGGKNLLDLAARNEAIQLMKLKSYLELDPGTRATWAYLADSKFAHNIVKSDNVDPESLLNMFLQTWFANRRKWPKHLKGMLCCALIWGTVRHH